MEKETIISARIRKKIFGYGEGVQEICSSFDIDIHEEDFTVIK